MLSQLSGLHRDEINTASAPESIKRKSLVRIGSALSHAFILTDKPVCTEFCTRILNKWSYIYSVSTSTKLCIYFFSFTWTVLRCFIAKFRLFLFKITTKLRITSDLALIQLNEDGFKRNIVSMIIYVLMQHFPSTFSFFDSLKRKSSQSKG